MRTTKMSEYRKRRGPLAINLKSTFGLELRRKRAYMSGCRKGTSEQVLQMLRYILIRSSTGHRKVISTACSSGCVTYDM